MQTIKHSGKNITITSAEARAINFIARNDVIAVSELAEGSGRHVRYNVNPMRLPGTAHAYTDHVKNSPRRFPLKVRRFVKNNPRVREVVYSDRGGAQRIAAKLGM